MQISQNPWREAENPVSDTNCPAQAVGHALTASGGLRDARTPGVSFACLLLGVSVCMQECIAVCWDHLDPGLQLPFPARDLYFPSNLSYLKAVSKLFTSSAS